MTHESMTHEWMSTDHTLPAHPPYVTPALSLRATFYATDGSRPEEMTVEWKEMPDADYVARMMEVIAGVAAGAHVSITASRSGEDPERPLIDLGRSAEASGVSTGQGIPFATGTNDSGTTGTDESTTRLPRPFCSAVGPAHDTEQHGCALYAGHEPVEPQGRRHRCRCGGVFGTEDEHPSVPGRRERDRERGRRP